VGDITDTHRLCDRFYRETGLSLPELEQRGEVFFQALYGETANNVQNLLDKIYPDMGEHTFCLSMLSNTKQLRRVVQQHDCLWISIRLCRDLKPAGDFVRLGWCAYRNGHPPPDCLAS
jgi:hypothetical protein